ncbi:MAG: hypothetical protein HYT11_01065, partial [Candidatus Levybacteria bacterium]|nr:hypothetical protein [Candidatus Levybacteria bacterium]
MLERPRLSCIPPQVRMRRGPRITPIRDTHTGPPSRIGFSIVGTQRPGSEDSRLSEQRWHSQIAKAPTENYAEPRAFIDRVDDCDGKGIGTTCIIVKIPGINPDDGYFVKIPEPTDGSIASFSYMVPNLY